MNKYERKIVLLYLSHIHQQNGIFAVINKIKSKAKAREEYDKMSCSDRALILRKIIIDYLVAINSKSLVFYYTNGTPNKTLFRMRELMSNKYTNMSDEERILIYKEFLSN